MLSYQYPSTSGKPFVDFPHSIHFLVDDKCQLRGAHGPDSTCVRQLDARKIYVERPIKVAIASDEVHCV